MNDSERISSARPAARRLSKSERRRQLLDSALVIVRGEGADRLTLGRLAVEAGVSKPVVYDHFATRSALLIALYKRVDRQQSDALRDALASSAKDIDETARMLAAAHVHCHVDTQGEWHAIGAALTGSEEKETVYQELLEGYARLFGDALRPYSGLSADELDHRCVGLIGAGDALSAAMVRGRLDETEATEVFAALIRGAIAEG